MTTEVGFYHLTRTSLAQALPPLLLRTLAAGQRAFVLCPNQAAITALSQALWAHEAWLPHGTPADGDAPLQPIWLDAEPVALNGARYLFMAGRADVQPDIYERVFDLFDGNDPAAVNAARDRWRAVKQAEHRLTYWQQTESGWQKRT